MTKATKSSVGHGGAREGAGRPRKMNLSVKRSTRDAIDALAESLEIGKGEVVEKAIEKFANSSRASSRETI